MNSIAAEYCGTVPRKNHTEIHHCRHIKPLKPGTPLDILRLNINILLLAIRKSLLYCFFSVLLLLTTQLTGCKPPSNTDQGFIPPLADVYHDPLHSARISSFLTLKNDQGPVIRLEVNDIEVIADNQWFKLNSRPVYLDSAKIGTSQLFLGGKAVPPGRYQSLRLTITKGEVQNSAGQFIIISSEPLQVELDLAAGLVLEAGDSGSLLLTWDLQNSVKSANTLDPEFTATPPLKPMLQNLIFATCPDIDTVFIVRADFNWVVDSFGMKGGPTYLAIDRNSNQLLYILASRDRMIKVVELSSYRVVNFFPVPLNDNPTFMVVTPDGRSGYLLDEQSGYLSRIDLTTGQVLARVLVGERPKYAVYLDAQNLLAVSLSLSQKVLLFDPKNLTVRGTITTGSNPQGLVQFNDQLIIAEYGDNRVSVADITSRGVQSQLTVGFGPRRLQVAGDQIFVSNYLDGSLSVLVPGQLGVIQEIYGLSRPLEMIYNQPYLQLYVTDEKLGSLAVIDTNSNRLTGHIFLGARPLGLEMIE